MEKYSRRRHIRSTMRQVSVIEMVPRTLSCLGLIYLSACADQHARENIHGFGDKVAFAQVAEDILSSTGDATILGVGEATHGSREFIDLRRVLLTELIQKGHVLLVLEMSVGEGTALNAYGQGRRDDLEDILSGSPLWMFRTEEFRDFMFWIREQNEKHETQIQIGGMEVQYVDRTIRDIVEYLKKVDPGTAKEAVSLFGSDRIAGESGTAQNFHFLWADMPTADMRAYLTGVLWVQEQLVNRKTDYLALSSEEAWQRANRDLGHIQQFLAMMIQPDQTAKHQMRDLFMFENVKWLKMTYDPDAILIWSHNAHVSKTEANGGYDVLGHLLKRHYGDDYFALGTSYGYGAFNAIDAESFMHARSEEDSRSDLTQWLPDQSDGYYLCLSCQTKTTLDDMGLNASLRVNTDVGANLPRDSKGDPIFYREIVLSARYDGVVFINQISAQTPLTQ